MHACRLGGVALALALVLVAGPAPGAEPAPSSSAAEVRPGGASGDEAAPVRTGAPAPGAEAASGEAGAAPRSSGRQDVALAPPLGEPTAAAPGAEARSVREWYALGGWVMHVLALVSVLVGALVLERCVALRGSAVLPGRLAASVREALERGRGEEARALCRASGSSLGRIVGAGLAAGRDPAAVLEALRGAGETELALLRRNLGLLAALGNLATMLGLLGTVLGMIEAFDLIARVGTGDARVVASGIFRALVTTAGGLGIGIGALGAHALLRRRVEGLALRLEEAAGALFARETEAPPVRTAAGAPDPVPAS